MLLLNLIPLIDVTFSTPTRYCNSYGFALIFFISAPASRLRFRLGRKHGSLSCFNGWRAAPARLLKSRSRAGHV